MIIDLHFTAEQIDKMFPCLGDEGTCVQASDMAAVHARFSMNLHKDTELTWHLPDVFAVRYGSSYVATASANGMSVRFHSNEGNFQEGDDRV